LVGWIRIRIGNVGFRKAKMARKKGKKFRNFIFEVLDILFGLLKAKRINIHRG
jgi:hypothetical protein